MTGGTPRMGSPDIINSDIDTTLVALPPGIDRAAIMRELDQICSSPELFPCTSLQKFLHHVVEVTLAGQAHQLKEYSIATSILGRREDFDPRTASIVRTQAGRLRARLESYYLNPPSPSRVQILLRPGSYVPQFLPGRDYMRAQDQASNEALTGIELLSRSLPSGIDGFFFDPLIEQSGNLLKLDLSLRHKNGGALATSESALIDREVTDTALAKTISRLYERVTAHFRVIASSTNSPHILSAMRACVEGDLLGESFQDTVLSQAGLRYDHAIRLASNYAPAYAGRAYLSIKRAVLGYDSATALSRLAQTAINQSMEFGPLAPRSLVAAGVFTACFEWNFTRATAFFRRAEAIVPHDAWTSAAFALFVLLSGGALAEAEEQIEKALEQDSHNPTAMIAQVLLTCQRRQFPDAEHRLRNYLSVHPQCGFGHLWLWKILVVQKRFEESASVLESAWNFAGMTPSIRAAFILQESRTRYSDDLSKFDFADGDAAYERAMIYAGSGEDEKAFASLQQAVESRSPGMIWLRSDPAFLLLNDDARFHQLLRHLQLNV